MNPENKVDQDNSPIENPRVSVIIPAYNSVRYIGKAITSVLAQTYRNWELIVVDDGSTDNSREVLSSFDKHIRYIWQENKGLAGARNTGIHEAKGELIGLLDADDEWLPTYLEKMVDLAHHRPDASVYYCRARGIDSEGNQLPQVFGGPPVPQEYLYRTLLRANFIIPSTILMHRSVLIRAGLFDQSLRYCEDWDLWLRLLPTHKIIGIKDILVSYRIHESSLSSHLDGMLSAGSMVEKQFGVDDGIPDSWTEDKKRAFGGVYRYYALTSIQRQGDWEASIDFLRKAFLADRSLSKDIDLFYELALGMQPAGYRGSEHTLSLLDNIKKSQEILKDVFEHTDAFELRSISRLVYGSANYAYGLALCAMGEKKLYRPFLVKAFFYRPELIFSWNYLKLLILSYYKSSMIEQIRILYLSKFQPKSMKND
jgi:glycosyltransferase involved in cell wall biosynthesis